MSEGKDLPEVEITAADILALYDAAIRREDFERAEVFADLILRRNDPEQVDR